MPFHSLALIKTLAGGLAYEASAGEYVPILFRETRPAARPWVSLVIVYRGSGAIGADDARIDASTDLLESTLLRIASTFASVRRIPA